MNINKQTKNRCERRNSGIMGLFNGLSARRATFYSYNDCLFELHSKQNQRDTAFIARALLPADGTGNELGKNWERGGRCPYEICTIPPLAWRDNVTGSLSSFRRSA
jgi:hypothetical protein